MIKILIIEDDLYVLEMLREVLLSMGVEPRCFNSPKLALEVIQREKFDGVTLDIMMPEVDGIQLTGAIRECRLNKKTPVVGISGSEDRRQWKRS
jgi:CheY-like chemotaxis protein